MNTTGNNEMKMNTAGYVSSCTIVADANVTAGNLTVVFSRNGSTVLGNTLQYCRMTSTINRTNSQPIPANAIPFNAGDTFGAEVSTSANYLPTSNDYMVYFTVTFPTGADVAETYFTGDNSISAGQVVSLADGMFAGVQKSSVSYDDQAIGVISTAPGLILGDSAGPGKKVYVALAGRVPVWVTTSNGPIKRGDWLTTSSIPGVAMKATKAGRVIGQAMTDYDGSGDGQVIMFIKNTSYNGSNPSKDSFVSTADPHSLLISLVENNTAASSSVVIADRVVAGLDIITPTVAARQLISSSLIGEIGSINLVIGREGGLQVVASGSAEPLFSVDSSGNALIKGKLTVNTLDAQYIPQIASMSAQIMTLASESYALGEFGRETRTMLTDADTQLAQSIASVSQRVDLLTNSVGALQIKIASISSAPALDLNKLYSQQNPVTFSGQVTLASGLTVDDISSSGLAIKIMSDAMFFGRPYFNSDTGGFAVVGEGQQEVRVAFDNEYLNVPVVSATITELASDSATSTIFASDIRFVVSSVDTKGFTIRMATSAPQDIRFSWIALAIKDARTILPPTPTPRPTLTPETPSVTSSASPEIIVTPTPVVISSSSALIITPTPPAGTPTPSPTVTIMLGSPSPVASTSQ